jgi:hypothetical protein
MHLKFSLLISLIVRSVATTTNGNVKAAQVNLIPNITGEQEFCINGNLRNDMFYLINFL